MDRRNGNKGVGVKLNGKNKDKNRRNNQLMDEIYIQGKKNNIAT